MKIELLLADADNTWTTKIFDCPNELDRNDLNEVQNWMTREVYVQTQYRNIVFFGVYNTQP